MQWHGIQCLRRLVPIYAVVFRLGWVYSSVTLCHRHSRCRKLFLRGTFCFFSLSARSIGQAAKGFRLWENSVYVFKQDNTISTFKAKHLKFVWHFTYLGSNILFTKSNINIRSWKARTAIDRLPTIWKFDGKNKTGILSSYILSVLLDGWTTWTLRKWWKKKLGENNTKGAARYFEEILKATHYKTTAETSLTSHLTNHPSKTNKKCWAQLEKQGWAHEWLSSVDSHTRTHKCWSTSKIYIHQLCADTACHQKNQLGAKNDRDR